MLEGVLLIVVAGFLAGELVGRLGLPKLIGMLLSGIILGPSVLGAIPGEVLTLSEEIRTLSLVLILFKAGLGLDKGKIMAQGSVAVRLAFLPAVIEASVVAAAAHLILGWSWLLSYLLGWIVCAASPAVIVPLMLRLKAEGWGTDKGIPDLILAGGTASDATAVTMFGIFLAWIVEDQSQPLGVTARLGTIPVQVVLGIVLGIMAGLIASYLYKRSQLTSNIIHSLIVSLGLGLLLVLGAPHAPFSPYLAVMVFGFVILERSPVAARQLRGELAKLWVVGEIFLFVLLGAAVNIEVIYGAGLHGLAIVGIGLVVGRWLGIMASTWGSSLTLPERGFMVGGDMAKATVQAAIGGIPLAMGVPHGEVILAISALSILVTAPLGAFLTVFLAPRILKKGKVDPTRVIANKDYVLLVAFDGSPASHHALEEAAKTSRQLDGRLVVLHVHQPGKPQIHLPELAEVVNAIAVDIRTDIMIESGLPSRAIVQTAQDHNADYIYVGKHNQPIHRKILVGDTAESVMELSPVPVILTGQNGST